MNISLTVAVFMSTPHLVTITELCMSRLRDVGFRIIEYQYVISLCSSGLLLVIPTPSCALTIAPPFVLLLMKYFRITIAETCNFQVAIFLLMSASPISVVIGTILLTKSLTTYLIQRIEDVTPVLTISISTVQFLGIILLLVQLGQVKPLAKRANR